MKYLVLFICMCVMSIIGTVFIHHSSNFPQFLIGVVISIAGVVGAISALESM